MPDATEDAVIIEETLALCPCCPISCEILNTFLANESIFDAAPDCCALVNGQDFSFNPITGYGNPWRAAMESIYFDYWIPGFPLGDVWQVTNGFLIYDTPEDCLAGTGAIGSSTVDANMACVVHEGIEQLRLLISCFSELDEFDPTPLPTRYGPLATFTEARTIALPDPNSECPPIVVPFDLP